MRRDGDTMRLIAHRGCAGQYPENTVAAMRAAAPHVDMVEFDVRRCGSGDLVVFHDETLSRLTGREGLVAGTDWSELRELTVCGSDEPVPLFENLLAAVPGDVAINVELKHAGMASEVLDALDGAENEALISSFHPDALAEVRGSEYPLGFIFDGDVTDGLAVASDLDCISVHPARRHLRDEVVERAHDAGFAVNVWTVKTREQLAEVESAGADGAIADRWDL